MQGPADEHQKERVAINAIAKPPPKAAGVIFLYRQGVDIAIAAFIEIGGGGMVQRVQPAPIVIGRDGEEGKDAACPVIQAVVIEEGTVAAIMLDDENAHNQPGGGHGQQQGQGVAQLHAVIHG